MMICMASLVVSKTGHLYCRYCGSEITHIQEAIVIPSSEALSAANTSIDGMDLFTQKFMNPEGIVFEVSTFKVTNATAQGDPNGFATFFPSFAWRFALCPTCQTHLGWLFQRESTGGSGSDKTQIPHSSFWGIIVQRLIFQSYVDSIVALPKFAGQ